MSIDQFISSFSHADWLATQPLGPIARQYGESMQNQHYSALTIQHYLSALAHFNYWAASRPLAVSNIGATVIEEFILLHLPTCTCAKPCFRGRLEIGAALRRLLKLLQSEHLVEAEPPVSTPVSRELLEFQNYLVNMCGLAMSTCSYRLRVVQLFLTTHFGVGPIDLAAFYRSASKIGSSGSRIAIGRGLSG
jgi:integrase/recombinase XerD